MRPATLTAASLRSFLLATVVGAGAVSAVHAQSASKPSGRELIQRRCQYAYVLLWKKDYAAAEEQFRKVLQEAPEVAA
jgi:Tfp pilus assembly protein PilF